jgi:hypothetical protein
MVSNLGPQETLHLQGLCQSCEATKAILGCNEWKISVRGFLEAWYMSTNIYLSKAIPMMKAAYENELHKKFTSPSPSDYHPELDTTPAIVTE